MVVPINNLQVRIQSHSESIKDAVDKVLARGWLVLGPEVEKFEASWAEYIGASYCIGVASGTDAIELALRGAGVTSGDRVATVANAGMYTTTATLAIGAIPFFVDVDPKTHNINLSEVDRALESGVKALVVTHLYGLAIPQIRQIAKLCHEKGVKLIEDCAQAHGAFIDNQFVGTFGDAASFSFYPTKNLGALGDAGAVVTNCSQVAERILSLRQYGWKQKYRTYYEGGKNSRLDEIQAAILQSFLPYLKASNIRRRQIAARYNSEIKNRESIILPVLPNNERGYVAHLYVIRVHSEIREQLRQNLKKNGVASEVHYPVPDYKQTLFKKFWGNNHLPHTEYLSQEVLTLPCYPEMTDEELNHVIVAINSFEGLNKGIATSA